MSIKEQSRRERRAQQRTHTNIDRIIAEEEKEFPVEQEVQDTKWSAEEQQMIAEKVEELRHVLRPEHLQYIDELAIAMLTENQPELSRLQALLGGVVESNVSPLQVLADSGVVVITPAEEVIEVTVTTTEEVNTMQTTDLTVSLNSEDAATAENIINADLAAVIGADVPESQQARVPELVQAVRSNDTEGLKKIMKEIEVAEQEAIEENRKNLKGLQSKLETVIDGEKSGFDLKVNLSKAYRDVKEFLGISKEFRCTCEVPFTISETVSGTAAFIQGFMLTVAK